MNPETAGWGMNSTSQPSRRRPMPRTMKPQMNARQVAITGAVHSLGCAAITALMMLPVSRDITATGPIETSLDVAKKAYVKTPMNDE